MIVMRPPSPPVSGLDVQLRIYLPNYPIYRRQGCCTWWVDGVSVRWSFGFHLCWIGGNCPIYGWSGHPGGIVAEESRRATKKEEQWLKFDARLFTFSLQAPMKESRSSASFVWGIFFVRPKKKPSFFHAFDVCSGGKLDVVHHPVQ